MKRSKNRYFSNDHGYSLLITLFALVLLSILGMSILTVSGNTLKNTSNERIDQAVYYIAEATVVEKRAEVLEKIKAIRDGINYNNYILKDNTVDIEGIKTEIFNRLKDEYGNVENNFERFNSTFNLGSGGSSSSFSLINNVAPTAEFDINVYKDGEEIVCQIIANGQIDNKERQVLQSIKINSNTIINVIEEDFIINESNGGSDPIVQIAPKFEFPTQTNAPSIIIANNSTIAHPASTLVNPKFVDEAKKWIEFAKTKGFTIITNGFTISNTTINGSYFVLNGDVVMNGNKSTKFIGTIIAPFSNIKINGNADLCGTIVANGYSASGGGNASISCSSLSLEPIENPIPDYKSDPIKQINITGELWTVQPIREI
ncbi:hypothetical protein [Lysinibacillus antri]|uniref:Type 4 fimbrial biogenesis protein PilX N-terminal domain-containing protein n=1 Tax=Lysinibacillus antri TaxID=2498145 RepID=A0A432LE71_9BACI|nr:hypothetical protein [Lysinibacillus antri]RUL55137.1 hypothetical protein EK386_05260 [Lysinibacillus antri]